MRALAAALLALLLIPAAARAQEDEGGQEYRVPMQTQTISAVLEVKPGERALSLYRSLIPRGYGMPRRPQVAVYLTEPNIPRKVPGQPYNDYTRWIEGPLAIKVAFGAEEGYFPIVMPVSSRFEYDLGRAAGLPKAMVAGALEPSENGFTVRTSVAGRNAITLRWRRAPVEVSEEENAWARNRYRLFALLPALVGPDLYYTRFTPSPVTPNEGTAPVPPPNVAPEPEPGFVDYDIDPDVDRLDPTLPDLLTARGATLADLVEPRGTVPGLYWDLPQILRLRSGDIGDGGGYDEAAARGVAPPPPLGLPARRACRSRRTLSIKLRFPRGDRARVVRVTVTAGGRRARSYRVRGRRLRRARIDLRGLPRGRFRVRVVARTRSGRTFTATRAYRTCVPRGR